MEGVPEANTTETPPVATTEANTGKTLPVATTETKSSLKIVLIILGIVFIVIPIVIMVIVAGVTIFWAAISPLIGQNLESGTGCFNVQNSLEIDQDKAYTCFDGIDRLFVKVARSKNSESLEGFEIGIENEGSEKRIYRVFPDELPTEDSDKVYMVKISRMETVELGKTKIIIAPNVKVNGEEVSCASSIGVIVDECLEYSLS